MRSLKMEISATRKICVKPFEWFEVLPNQERSAYLCCSAWLPKSIGSTLGRGGEIKDVQKLWDSAEAKEVRRSVIDGSFRFCNDTLCPNLRNCSGPVKNVGEQEYDYYSKLADGECDSGSGFGPRVLNCSYDQSCNLACPTCRKDIIQSTKKERLVNERYIENLLSSFRASLKQLLVTGSGDPFGSRHFRDMLCGDLLKSYPNINLNLHTNAQLLTRERWAKLSHLIGSIKCLEVSIDAASKEIYEINRYPGKWGVLLENMDYISLLRRENKFTYLKIDFIVQKNNWREMKDFVKLGRGWGVDCIYFSTLNNWGTFDEEEYTDRAVHDENHEEFLGLKELLSDDCFNGSDVKLGFFDSIKYDRRR